jgi:WD40 repeat protein
MPTPAFQRMEELFHQALTLRPEERPAFLDCACAGDADLRAAVDNLLAHAGTNDSTGGFLASPVDRPPLPEAPTRPGPAEGDTGAVAAPLPRIPGYQVLGELGRGGMGIVYKARQLALNRLVALKMLPSATRPTPQHLARFRAEAEALARLHHPNIVPIYDVGEVDGRPYFTMEYVPGPSLARVLDGRPQDPQASARLLGVLARGMHAVHQCGLIHRDLKPANVLLCGEWAAAGGGTAGSVPASLVPKITDFGLAKDLATEQQLTQPGLAMGTPSYMAPEQARGAPSSVGPATDIYALGSILYEMLTGRPPFDAATPAETLTQLLHDDPLSPARLRPGLPRDLVTICLKCLEKSPRRRYASALDLAEDLRRFLAAEPIGARPVGPFGRTYRWCRRRPLVAALLALLALVGAGFVGTVLAYDARLRLANGRLEEALAKAEVNNENQRQDIVQLNVDLGVTALEEEDDFAAVLHFTEALRLDQGAPDHEANHRTRIGTALRQSPRLVQFLLLDRPVVCTYVGPAGARVATAGDGQRLEVWDVLTGRPAAPALPLEGVPAGGTFSPDARSLATVGADGSARLWDLATGKSEELPGQGDDAVRQVTFCGDGHTLLARHADGGLRLWDLSGGHPVLRRGLPEHGATFAVVSEDGRRLATVTAGRVGQIWDTATGDSIVGPVTLEKGVSRLAMSPDGGRVAALGRDRLLRVGDVAAGRWMDTPLRPRHSVTQVVFGPDGERLLTAGSDPAVMVWQVRTGELVAVSSRHGSTVTHAGFSPDGSRVLTGTDTGEARVWDAATGLALTPPLGQGGPLDAAAFSADGKRVVSVRQDGAVWVWELPAAPEARPEEAAGEERAVDGAPRFTRLRNGATVRVHEPASAASLHPPGPVDRLVDHAAFSPDGRRVTVAGTGNTARVWDTATGEPVTPRLRHGAPAVYAAFSPDGRRLLTADESRVVRLWDAETGEVLAPPLRNARAVERVAFAPDGTRAWVVYPDGLVRTWDLSPDPRPVDELVALAEVLSCARLDERQDRKALEEDALRSAWKKLQAPR